MRHEGGEQTQGSTMKGVTLYMDQDRNMYKDELL